MAWLPPYQNYKPGDPVPRVASSAQIAKLRTIPDFTGRVWPIITRNWGPDNLGRPISILIDDHVNTACFVWMYKTEEAWVGYQGKYKSLDDYIARATGSAQQFVPTPSQVAILRNCLDFQNVIQALCYDRSQTPPKQVPGMDPNDVSHVMSVWATFPSFQKEYGTIEGYIKAKCGSSGSGTGNGGSGEVGSGGGGISLPSDWSIDGIRSWVEADFKNGLIAAGAAYLAIKLLFKGRR